MLSNKLNQYINKQSNLIESIVNNITSNKQYQSWLFDVLKQFDYSVLSILDFLHVYKQDIIDSLNKFTTICKSPKVPKDLKDIQKYQTLASLSNMIDTYKEILYKHLKIELEKIYSNNSYDIYAVYKEDKEQFQNIYGEDGYDCGWCVVNPDKNMFEYYLNSKNDCYYLWTLKDINKPFALTHITST